MTYLAYHISDYNDKEDMPPIAAHADKDACLSLAIRRILGLGWTHGGVSVVHRPDVDDEDALRIENGILSFLPNKGVFE